MIENELKGRWINAQQSERQAHDQLNETMDMAAHYQKVYRHYMRYLSIDEYQRERTILEIGPGDFPMERMCLGYKRAILIEPMPSEALLRLIEASTLPIELIRMPAEEINFPKVDECWILNVLQHTMLPDVIIARTKLCAKVVRFFEPIDTAIDNCHIHSFNEEYFRLRFGDAVKIYEPQATNPDFFNGRCAYGVWTRETSYIH